MSILFRTGLVAVLRVLTSVIVIVVLVGNSPASAAPELLSPADTHPYAERILQSVWRYWASQLAAVGHPGWGFQYRIIDGADIVNSPCGVRGDPGVLPGAIPAGYCPPNNAVYFSATWLYNEMSNNGTTPYGIANVMAHEVGHAVQAELGLPRARVEPKELQADCFSGMWVRRQVNVGTATTQDAADARRAAQSSGDYDHGGPDHHGSPGERGAAWMIGFNGGSCLALNPSAGS